jgi:hypothetical protein
MRLAGSLLCALLVTPVTAVAREGGFLDLMYTIEPEFEISDPSGSVTLDSGSGLSLRGRSPFADRLFLQGEYVVNEYEEVEGSAFEAETTRLRGGLGLKAENSALYGLFEFVKQEIDLIDAGVAFDDTGIALSLGLQSRSAGNSAFHAQVGYLDLGDFGDGLEFSVGAAFGIGPQSAILVDYRNSVTEDDSGGEGQLSDLRVGLRIRFGD